MRKRIDNTVMHSYPGMVAIVTAEWNGERNVMAAGWHTYISYEPPIYGVAVAKERYTHHLIENSKQFAINFVPADKAEIIQFVGSNSGENVDKFAQLSFTKGETIETPILKDAYIAYECKVIDQNTYGDHDFFVGEITCFYKDVSLFTQDGLPQWENLNIPLYLGRSKYLIANERATIIDLYKK
ncbi:MULTISPECIES: flavin reductase family protein [Sutcliffiella]|uniref:flavin reductase family protein n=1 Tax=Sutcliffiella TaxID=2837511 RepID=UPI0022DDBA84|nr:MULTISPECIES: flavin reductase family protein [Sutcliffiella]MED4016482.1 flavin reductase family protein [Sutcliffiella cohnii]WBL13866.1 flavin reductase family protein [Sutcliffiella sp. NC1]